MANEFVARKGIISSGSIKLESGSFFGPLEGTASFSETSSITLKVRIISGAVEESLMSYTGSFSGSGEGLRDVTAANLQTVEPVSPIFGSAFFSGSFLYIFDGNQYRSASFN
jgi:hypothetical protein